jgi:hypothetical protein
MRLLKLTRQLYLSYILKPGTRKLGRFFDEWVALQRKWKQSKQASSQSGAVGDFKENQRNPRKIKLVFSENSVSYSTGLCFFRIMDLQRSSQKRAVMILAVTLHIPLKALSVATNHIRADPYTDFAQNIHPLTCHYKFYLLGSPAIISPSFPSQIGRHKDLTH